MSRVPRHVLLMLAVLFAVFLAVAPAVGDDDDGGGDQQGEVDGEGDDAQGEGDEDQAEGGEGSDDGEDGGGEGGEGEEGEGDGEGDGEEPRQGIGDGNPSQFINAPGGEREDEEGEEGGSGDFASYRAFHPTYRLDQKVDQDVTSWTHAFTMNYPLSEKISFRSNANINTRTNDAADRLNRQETWAAGLDMNVSSAIKTGVDFRRTRHLDIQHNEKPNETSSEREKESVKLSTSYTKLYSGGIDVALGANAGIEKNAYTDVTSRGSTQGISGRLTYQALENLTTTFSYTGNHSLLDSEQGALASTDESVNHDLSSRVDYGWAGHKVTVDLRRATGKKEYPKDEQTELKENENESTGVTADLALLEGMGARLGFNYSRNQQYYRVEPSRNSDILTRGVEAHLTYDVGETSFKADMGSDRRRNDYFDVQSGDNYSNTLSMSLSQVFREGLDASLRARMSLLSVHYDDIAANDQDRDLFDREATLTVNYRARSDITTGLTVRMREDQLIYIRRTRTGDNKTTQKYSVEPFIRKTFTPYLSANQRYTLSADYTFYQYDEDSNFLIRNMSVTTGVNIKPIAQLDLGLEHTYRSQDEGSYVENEFGVEGYGRSSERADQSLRLTVTYKIADLINIEVKQNLSVQDKWRIDEEGTKNRVWDKYDTSLIGRASTDYSLPDGTRLTASVAKTLRDATSISDRQRDVWNIAVSFNRTF